MTVYYVDNTATTTALTGTLTFTNASSTVTGTGTLFTTELAVGDYIKSDDATNGTEWYKVTAITDDLNLTIDHAFAQATHSATASKNSNDGLSTTTAFATPRQFLDATLSPGDICYLRRGQTWTITVDIGTANDGALNNLIIMQGDDGTGWPTETGNARPIIDMATITGITLYMNYDYYWEFRDITFKSDAIDGVIKAMSRGRIIDCDLLSPQRSFRHEVTFCEELHFVRVNCDNQVYIQRGGVLKAWDSTLNSINMYGGGHLYLENCSVTTLTLGTGIVCRGKNNNITTININAQDAAYYSEDDQQVAGANKAYLYMGTLEKDTTNIRTGGGSSSIKASPNSNVGSFAKLQLFEYPVYLPATATTITVYMLGFGWTTFPTANELWIELEYLDSSTGTTRTTIKSTETLVDNTNWTAFTVSATPGQEGVAYLRGYLTKYELNSGVYVDIKPVLS